MPPEVVRREIIDMREDDFENRLFSLGQGTANSFWAGFGNPAENPHPAEKTAVAGRGIPGALGGILMPFRSTLPRDPLRGCFNWGCTTHD